MNKHSVNESPEYKKPSKRGDTKGMESETLVSIDILLEMEKQEKESFIGAIKSNAFQSYMNSIKIFLGNVYLTMPNVFSKTGWLGGILLYSIICVLNTYTMRQIIEVGTVYSNRKNANGITTQVKSYTDLATRIHG